MDVLNKTNAYDSFTNSTDNEYILSIILKNLLFSIPIGVLLISLKNLIMKTTL